MKIPDKRTIKGAILVLIAMSLLAFVIAYDIYLMGKL